jgi:hypothetical protein
MNDKDQQPALDAEERQLRELAATADSDQGYHDNDDAAERGGREPEAGTKEQNSEKSQDAGTAAVSPKTEDRGQKTEDSQKAEQKTEQKADPKETAYTKLQKEQERLARNRREFEEEKARERAALETERQKLRTETTKPAPRSDDPLNGFTAEQLDTAADKLEAQGKYDLANEARKAAAERRKAPKAEDRGQRTEDGSDKAGQATPEFMQQWRANLEREVEANPELRSKDTPLYQATAKVLQTEPWLQKMPDGINKAVRVAKLQAEAAAVPTLKAKIAEMEKELTDLRTATSLSGGSAESRGRAKKPLQEMSDSEAEAEIRQLAAETDALALT